MYGLIALILLLSAIWLGLSFANGLVAPIRRMIDATDQVSSGNFYVQVPIRRSEGDLAHLGETFNKMTAELRRQRDSLVTASEVIDRRRRFTETVLSGVSSGVLSLDGDGHANGEILQREDGEDGALKLVVRLPVEREGAFTARFPEAVRQG